MRKWNLEKIYNMQNLHSRFYFFYERIIEEDLQNVNHKERTDESNNITNQKFLFSHKLVMTFVG